LPLLDLHFESESLKFIGITPSQEKFTSLASLMADRLFNDFVVELNAKLATINTIVHNLFLEGEEYQLTADIIRDENDKARHVCGVLQSITKEQSLKNDLLDTNLRLKAILEFAGVGVWGLDKYGITSFVNENVCQLTGYLPSDLIGKSSHDIVHHSYPDGRPYPKEDCPIYSAFTFGKTYTVDDEFFWRKDGTSFDVEYVSTPIIKDGDIDGAVVVCRDISKKKQALRTLNSLKKNFEVILSSVDIGILGFDRDKKISFVNETATKLCGWMSDEIVGAKQHDIFHHSHADGQVYSQEDCLMCEATDKGYNVLLENEIFWRKDGTCFPVEYKSTPLIVNEKIEGTVVVFSDISERILNLELLRDSVDQNERMQEKLVIENRKLEEMSERFKLILESTQEGIYGLDKRGVTVFANQATHELTGWKAKDIIGQVQHDVLHHSHKDGSPYSQEDCPIYKASNNGIKEHRSNEVFWRKDGSYFPVEYTSSPIKRNGVSEGSVVIFRDISQRLIAERTLESAHQEIDRLNSQLSAENHYLKEEIETVYQFNEIIGDCQPLKEVLHKVEKVAATNSHVLVLGESGTGKELIAHAIHKLSKRSNQTLIKVNCASMNSNVIENELFGHEKRVPLLEQLLVNLVVLKWLIEGLCF